MQEAMAPYKQLMLLFSAQGVLLERRLRRLLLDSSVRVRWVSSGV